MQVFDVRTFISQLSGCGRVVPYMGYPSQMYNQQLIKKILVLIEIALHTQLHDYSIEICDIDWRIHHSKC